MHVTERKPITNVMLDIFQYHGQTVVSESFSLSVVHFLFFHFFRWGEVASMCRLGSLIPLGLYNVDGESSQTHVPNGCRWWCS